MRPERTKTYIGLAAVGAAAAVTLAALPSPPQSGSTFAVVNTEVVLQQTPGFTAAESTWNAEVAIIRADLEGLSQTLDSALRAFDQTSIGLSPTARQEKQDELQRLNRQYQQRTTDAQARAEQRQRELMAPLQTRIQAVVDGIRAERNLGLVFDVAAPGNNVMSADPTLNLTALVVRRLQGGAQ
ncbi:MAG: OmpH family outer membrane protein [Gemmatimonadota bacterium]|nr:OmpH family outer membrane protein [Gemmatimonadota bacterium]MDH5198275.1 OmpH family outer membrane protein [Gemmatimonadota bacterium]